MSEDKDPFEPMVRATLAEMDQEQVTTGVIYAGDAFMMGGFNPFSEPDPSQTIEAERKQARAELRDRFAAAALMGMMGSRNPSSPRFHPEDDAAYVYAVADAMLKARSNICDND